MKLRFHIPLFLKPLADDQSDVELEVDARTVDDALRALFARHPGLRDRVMTEQFTVRPHVNVFVGEEAIRFTGGLSTAVRDGDVLTLLPAVSGGASSLAQLLDLLRLEKIEENLFRGQSQDLGWGTVYGGQVLGQALSAAAQTVPSERQVHSLHAYFLRPGDVSRPVLYQVDRSRDGGTITSRRVQAVQNGSAIFTLAASFQATEDGFTHQDAMPKVPPPEQWPTEQERFADFIASLPSPLQERYRGEHPFEYRSSDPKEDPRAPKEREARRSLWFKTTGPVPDDPSMHKWLLAYASDHSFIATAMLPHGVSWLSRGMQVASLDHACWFHGDFRVDDWLLYTMDSPAASGGRGLVRGQIFTRDGRLVASTVQEGLIRRRT